MITMPEVHVNSRWVNTGVHDLDVYDRYTLECAICSLAWHINQWVKMGKTDMAQPYIAAKSRIKKHLGGHE